MILHISREGAVAKAEIFSGICGFSTVVLWVIDVSLQKRPGFETKPGLFRVNSRSGD
jgi:hypothetical protein